MRESRIADRVPVNYTTNVNASVVSSFGKSEWAGMKTQNLVIFPSRHSELEDGGLLCGLVAKNYLVGHLASTGSRSFLMCSSRDANRKVLGKNRIIDYVFVDVLNWIVLMPPPRSDSRITPD